MRHFICCAFVVILTSTLSLAAERYTQADVDALIAKIDKHMAKGWSDAKVKPTIPATDAELLRRVWLDLAGRIPTVAEAREHLSDKHKDKYRRLVNELLDHRTHRYVTHFGNLWTDWLLPEARANTNFQIQFLVPRFQRWIETRLRQNVAYDKLAHELLTAPIRPGNVFQIQQNAEVEEGILAYYQTKEFKAENIAAASSRLFLGVRLECAQCHDHPFAIWSRDQFWSYTAFFAGIRPASLNNVFNAAAEDISKREIEIPGGSKKKIVQATFLDNSQPKWSKESKPREILADWITSGKNPYFAKAIVNRMWEYFMGTGLVEPID